MDPFRMDPFATRPGARAVPTGRRVGWMLPTGPPPRTRVPARAQAPLGGPVEVDLAGALRRLRVTFGDDQVTILTLIPADPDRDDPTAQAWHWLHASFLDADHDHPIGRGAGR